MIKALIIDDVEKARVALRSDIKSYCPEVDVIGEADGVEIGMRLIKAVSPDVVFLDIKMSDGSGFDLIDKLKKENIINFQVIFTTAYNEFAIKAFKFSAIDYLLKPVDPDDLMQAVKKIRKSESKDQLSENLNLLLENIKGMQTVGKRIALNSIDKVQLVNVSDIIQCESQKNYTIFYLQNHKQILVTKTLKEFEEMLESDGFLRVHHSHLINLKHLKEYIKADGGYAVMSDSSQVPVSVRKREQLLRILGV
ncbi:LytR/AlgR family response regulator transcription factor [Sporocytophaga myxococcoides]|uniref:LytR/AlgR family response regulator transcription factor n=1 Tax=Sporocytophaga myxococcoides TaxID=153721 RepID=UPI000425657D|nr:LytTR family DNA-binding domain-containing protein [Sporocytophaga myxococcoides]